MNRRLLRRLLSLAYDSQQGCLTNTDSSNSDDKRPKERTIVSLILTPLMTMTTSIKRLMWIQNVVDENM
jgi:hypothetical protein